MSTTTTTTTSGVPGIDEAVRAVTDTEVAFFKQNGWVALRGLVSPELSRAMLERGAPRFEGLLQGGGADFARGILQIRLTADGDKGEGIVTDNSKWIEWRGGIRSAHDPVLSRAALAPTMGRNMQRLLGRDKQMRIYHDIFLCKLADNVSVRTEWHQDSVAFPLDRQALTVWIALDEVTPDQGPVQFFSGSHRCGMLGRIPADRATDLLDEYPELARFSLSPPLHLQPGDATVHHGLVVHGAGTNNTPRPRWSYAVCYFPSDARYTGSPNHDCDGYDLKVGQHIEHPSFTPVPD